MSDYHVFGGQEIRRPITVRYQQGEYTKNKVSPGNLCPFTVDVYPAVFSVGDPLYIRINFQNNTNTDVFALVEISSYWHVDSGTVTFHLKENNGEVIPWALFNGSNDAALQFEPIWQKVKPGENGQTQYMTLVVPRTLPVPGSFAAPRGIYDNSFPEEDRKRWDEIVRSEGDTVGKLVTIIKNHSGISVNHSYISEEHHTLSVDSPEIVIKPRDPRQQEIINEISKMFSAPDNFQKQDIEHAISELPPGVLQNLFTYELLLMELEEVTRKHWDVWVVDKEAEMLILGVLEKIEQFLNPLPEIERENLKRNFQKRLYFEISIRNNKKLQKRFNEVFGEYHVYTRLFPSWGGTESMFPRTENRNRPLRNVLQRLVK